MRPIDSENVIAWLNAQIEYVQLGWLHDYGFPTNVIAALTEVKRFVKNLPTIEPKVRHGRWIDKGEYAVCTECGGRSGTQYDGVEPIALMARFCQNCGARMDGGADKWKEKSPKKLKRLLQVLSRCSNECCLADKCSSCPNNEIDNLFSPAAELLILGTTQIECRSKENTGEWEKHADFLEYCTICGAVMSLPHHKFCGNCGAEMMKVSKDATDTNVGGKGGDDNVSNV
jgi:hypothetical protein